MPAMEDLDLDRAEGENNGGRSERDGQRGQVGVGDVHGSLRSRAAPRLGAATGKRVCTSNDTLRNREVICHEATHCATFADYLRAYVACRYM